MDYTASAKAAPVSTGNLARYRPLALHRPGDQPADDVALERHREDEDRDRRQRGTRREHLPTDVPHPDGLLNAHRQRLRVLARAEDQVEHELVPGAHEGEDRRRAKARPREWQRDPVEQPDPRAAVD